MNNYEGMFIVNPQLSDDSIEKVVGAIEEEIKKNDGTITNSDRIGRRHMAYKIKKFQDGYYLLLNFQGQGDLIGKVLPKYRINDDILRNLIIKR